MTKTANSISLNRFSEPIQEILRELCRRVGADPEKLDYARKDNPKDEWYNQYEWTQEQSSEFMEWLEEFAYKHARKLGIPKNKSYVKRCLPWFSLYTWKIKTQ